MFTGIVQAIGKVVSVTERGQARVLTIDIPAPHTTNLSAGASVSVDGVCLTVSDFADSRVTFDVISETLCVSTLADVKPGARVNIERSAKFGDEIGGHQVSGHVDGRGLIEDIKTAHGVWEVTLKVPAQLSKYLFRKGFIAVNGTSITVADVDRQAHTFRIALIPETLERTNLGEKRIGHELNIEVERTTQVLVDTITTVISESLAGRS